MRHAGPVGIAQQLVAHVERRFQGSDLVDRRKIIGLGVETQTDTRLDRDRLRGDPIVVFLAQRSRVDVLREARTGKLYALESNPGGNTWHFSSAFGELLREEVGDGRRKLLAQYNALPLAAKTLAEATRAYAR